MTMRSLTFLPTLLFCVQAAVAAKPGALDIYFIDVEGGPHSGIITHLASDVKGRRAATSSPLRCRCYGCGVRDAYAAMPR